MSLWYLPGSNAIAEEIQGVKVVQISWDIVLRVVAVIRQTPEEEHPVANKGEAVPQTRTRRLFLLGGFWLETLPFPSAGLELVQFVGVLSILHHSPKN